MLAELPVDLIVALIAAAAAGWLIARVWPSDNRRQKRSARPAERDYFRGLNYLLNEEPDKALEVFLQMVDVDNDTVETHFALGSLYRRRGEVDRAIRIHENIIQRPGLSGEHREHATFALAEDYFRAGLFDRAEQLFQQLAAKSMRRGAALRYLLRIYEQQRDWSQAIATHQHLATLASPESPTAIAHYYCELAERARHQKDFDTARELLRQARGAQRNFPRGAIIRADIALDMGDAELAARLCRRAVELHPQLLPLALPRYAKAVQLENSKQSFTVWLRSDAAGRAELAYAAIIAGLEQEPFALECLRDFIREDPNLGDLVPALAGNPAELNEAQLRPLGAALGRIFRRTQRYRCVECGFASTAHFWQCPGCRSWDALAPVSRLEVAPNTRGR